MKFHQLASALAIAVLCTGAPAQSNTAAAAQKWPVKPIKWIVPYPPGGITDNATRVVLQKVQERT